MSHVRKQHNFLWDSEMVAEKTPRRLRGLPVQATSCTVLVVGYICLSKRLANQKNRILLHIYTFWNQNDRFGDTTRKETTSISPHILHAKLQIYTTTISKHQTFSEECPSDCTLIKICDVLRPLMHTYPNRILFIAFVWKNQTINLHVSGTIKRKSRGDRRHTVMQLTIVLVERHVLPPHIYY
jgi:hypothetical protein